MRRRVNMSVSLLIVLAAVQGSNRMDRVITKMRMRMVVIRCMMASAWNSVAPTSEKDGCG